MNETLKGKTVRNGRLGNTPHKFVWYNRSHEEFSQLTKGKAVGEAWAKGRWLFLPLQPGYVLLLGECGGKMLYHLPGAKIPKKYHLYIEFEDDSFFTTTTQMWDAMELYEEGKEQDREHVRNMRPTPIEPAFTFDHFSSLIDAVIAQKKQSVKGLLTQDQLLPGLGNAIAQDITFHAHLHPKRATAELDIGQRRALFDAILNTVNEVIAQNGRYDETDLYNIFVPKH